MSLVLLSGGSGKRLWPLSNDIRSKQFIPLFKTANGEYISMVQRVFQQIQNEIPNTDITIATSQSQVSAIHNQLGSDVNICVEPFRRDTFPAIALVCEYLSSEKKLGHDEAVVICPVDPYVDDTYFRAIHKLEQLVSKSDSGLTLMGIDPTYPSEKYGYIIPEDGKLVSQVTSFKEKPSSSVAKELLSQHALWNAGVFGFKLGYLLKRAHQLIEYTDYADLLNKYEQLEKISFDYAVVENEQRIQVLRYSGEWKDVGTWNTMSEVMTARSKGNVLIDEKSHNTNVVNELSIPVLALGCDDLIIAASNDGILVSDKQRSGYMKPYVEQVELGVHYAEKSWGTYTVLDVQPTSMTVQLQLRSNEKLSYHKHLLRDEVWTIISGDGYVIINDKKREISVGSTISVPAGTKHQLIAKSSLRVIEVQIGEEISNSDKIVYR